MATECEAALRKLSGLRNKYGRLCEQRSCEVCHSEFLAQISEIKRGKGKVCSLSCAAALTPAQDQRGQNNSNWKGGASSGGPIEKRKGYRQAKRVYSERHPEKTKAHMAVRAAIASGALQREPCEICSSTFVEAHHDDYGKPLSVRWLCKQHHKEHHVFMRSAGLEEYSRRQPQ